MPQQSVSYPTVWSVTLSGWTLFLLGLLALLALHTLRDRLAHQALLPLFLLLSVIHLACVWDGSKAASNPVLRFLSFFGQVTLTVGAAVMFVHLLLQQAE